MRVLLCTYPKSGSQWMNDLLGDRDVLRIMGWTAITPGEPPVLPSATLAYPLDPVPENCVYGPIYNLDRPTILWQLRETDRVIHLSRDPRDIAVSYIHSILHSHDPKFSLDKKILGHVLAHAEREDRMRLALWWTAAIIAYPMSSWFGQSQDARLLETSYEALLADTAGILQRIFDFLGVTLKPGWLERMVDEQSFEVRCGRKPGEENRFSHYRKGIAGDWRNHFSRETGEIWETAMPGLLVKSGYESDSFWWKDLPSCVEPEPPSPSLAAPEIDILQRRITELYEEKIQLQRMAEDRLWKVSSLHEEALQLRRQCEEKQAWIEAHQGDTELAVLRRELELQSRVAAERLQLIEVLHAKAQDLQRQCEEKEQLIQKKKLR